MGRTAATKLLRVCWLLLVLPALTQSRAQTLAHKGWAGSGLTVAPWWQSAILYNVDPVSFQDSKGDGFGDFRGLAQRLDYLQTLGVDVLVLSPLQSGPSPARAETTQPFDAAYGTPEALDTLIGDASRHKIRILADLRLSGAQTLEETLSLGRFWLSRGVAGLRLTLDSADALDAAKLNSRLRELKRLCANYAGDRVLFWDVAAPDGSQRMGKYAATTSTTQMVLANELETLPRLDAALLHSALAALPQVTQTRTVVLATDSDHEPRSWDRFGENAHPVELARILATALLTVPGAPMLYFGQEIGMATTPAPAQNGHAGNPTPMQWGDARGFTDGAPWIPMGRNTATANVAMEDVDRYSLLNWYRRLTALRHANAMLREGAMHVMDMANPAVVAWVRVPKVANAMASPVIVLCNLSDRPVAVSIASELRRLAIPTGTGVMHTLATTETPAPISAASANPHQDPDPAYDAPVSVNSISLPPFGVYVGELRHSGGLETQPAPVRSRSRR